MSRGAKTFAGRAKIRPAKNALLLPFQSKWVNDKSPKKLGLKARQIGWSWATAYEMARDTALTTASADVWASSRDEIQATLLLEDVKHFADILQLGADAQGEQVIDERGHTAHVLRFANGRRVFSMSSNPDAQAGKRGTRVLDEFALHPDPRRLFSIAWPGVTWGGKLIVFSTPRGSANFFQELIDEIEHKGNPKLFSFHRVTLQDALDQGFLHRLQTKLPAEDPRQQMDEAAYFDYIKAGCPDEEAFMQEYCCTPADDNSAFLSYDLIASCEYRPTEKWETDIADAKGQLWVGVDVGRMHDLTVITVIEELGDVKYVRRMIELKGIAFDAQESALYDVLSLTQVRRCCIDSTGIGRQFAERAQQRFGRYKIEPVNFSAPVKEELAYPLRAAFEDRSVRIPSSPALRSDLRAIRKESTASGNIRFTADRGMNGHSDRFWALALALHAAHHKQEAFAVVA